VRRKVTTVVIFSPTNIGRSLPARVSSIAAISCCAFPCKNSRHCLKKSVPLASIISSSHFAKFKNSRREASAANSNVKAYGRGRNSWGRILISCAMSQMRDTQCGSAAKNCRKVLVMNEGLIWYARVKKSWWAPCARKRYWKPL
jgi:hypothetical protein